MKDKNKKSRLQDTKKNKFTYCHRTCSIRPSLHQEFQHLALQDEHKTRWDSQHETSAFVDTQGPLRVGAQ